MKKLVLAVSLLLLVSTGISVVDSSPEQLSQQQKQDRTHSQGPNQSDIIEKSYIVELEGEPVSSELSKYNSVQGLRTQSLARTQETKKQKIQETRARFNRELQTVTERPYKVKGKFENVFNGISISNISNSTLDEIKAMDEVEEVYRDRMVHVQVQDSVPNIGAGKAHRRQVNGENITGKGVEVAVIDTGTDYSHSNLGGCTFQEVNNSKASDCRFLPGYDFVDNEYDPMDEREHGTHVAGIVGAKGPNIEGVAPDTSIRPYRVCASAGCSTSNILAAVDRAMDPDNDSDTSDHVDIIQMSIGGQGYPSDPMSQAMNEAFDAGVLPVISAGNSGSAMETVGDPATARKSLAVGAVDDRDELTQFSSRGPQKVLGSTDILFKPEISAPGYGIYSTLPSESFGSKSGTSMAAPHVSGAAALILQKYGSLGPQEVKSLLTQTSTSVDQDNNGDTVGLLESGTGRVNVTEALSTSSVVTPEVLSFGLSNSTGKWWNVSENITVKNFGDVSKSYSISESIADSGASIEFNESSLTLDAGEDKTVSVNLSVNKEELGTGEFTGKISVSSDAGEDLELSYLFVNQDFSLDVNPEYSKDGKFMVQLESPMDFDKFDREIYIERPDGKVTTETVYEKFSEWRPDNQNFNGEISLDEPGEYRIIANSSLLPGKEASVNITVEDDSPVLSDSSAFPTSDRLEVNVSSSDDLGSSADRRIELIYDHTLFQPEALSFEDEFHLFWDAGGYDTDLRYSVFSEGELNWIKELQFDDSGQVKDVSVERKGSEAFVTWYSSHSSSGRCSSYCYNVYGALIDLEDQEVVNKYSITEDLAERRVREIDTARKKDKIVIGWTDNRANRPSSPFSDQNLSFMARTFDMGSRTLSDEINISYKEPVLQSISLKASDERMQAFWKASRGQKDPAVYTRKFSDSGLDTERQVTNSYIDISYRCEVISSEAVCAWRQPTSDAGGEIYSGSSSENWTAEFLDYSDTGVLKTESSNDKFKLVYKNGSSDYGYTESYRERVYDGSWSESSQVLGDVENYNIESLSGVENSEIGVLSRQDVITDNGEFGIDLDTASVFNPESQGNPSPLFEAEYPISEMKTVEGENSHFIIFDSRAHQGYYDWLNYGTPSNFVMRVSKRPETTVTLPDGSKASGKMTKENGDWSTELSTDQGGTHIYRTEATNEAFSKGTVRGLVSRNISDGTNSRPGRPDWKSVEGTTEDRRPLLNWTEPEDPDGDELNYILTLDESEDFSSPEVLKNTENTSFRPGKLANGEYHYRVYATDGYQDGEALKGSFNVTEYVNFTVSNNTSIDEDIEINSIENAKFNVSKGDWSYSGSLFNDSGNYSREFSLHRYGFYNVTVWEESDSGEVLGSKTKKVFVNASRPEIDYFQIEGRTDREYPTAMDEFEVNVDYSSEVASLTGSLKASNSTWSEEYNTTIQGTTYERENYATDEEYVRAGIPGLLGNVSGLSGGEYNLTVTLGNSAGTTQENFSISPGYINFTVSNSTDIGEDVEINSNESAEINISRGNWSYSADLFSYRQENHSESVPLYNQGFYNVTVFEETIDGEIFSTKTKRIFVNASKPDIEQISLGSSSNTFPVAGENITLRTEFDTYSRPLNGSFVVSNSSWSKEFNGSLTYDEVSEQSYITDENYTAYTSTSYPGGPVNMKTDIGLEPGKYNITARPRNTEGLSEANISRKLFEEINITANIDQERNATRSVALFVENQQSILAQANLKKSENISVPNITSAGREFSIAVTSNNISDYQIDEMDYIWDINTSLGENITVEVTESSEEKRIGDRIFYNVFSSIYNGKNSTDKSKILVARNSTKISQKANSADKLTIYNCKNFSQSSEQCQTDWEEPENVMINNYSSLEFTGITNYSEAVALGEPVKPCYPDCEQEQEEREDESDDSSSSSGGFTGGFTPPERPEVKSNGNKTTVENLEAGEASISSDPGINSVSVSSSNAEYSMEIEESSSQSSEDLTEDYEVFESYDLSVSENGENVTDTENEVTITFSVDKAWIDERNVSRDDVKLYHREQDSWETRETLIDRVEAEKVFYSANTSEFSDYMIAAEKKDEPCIQEVTSASSPENTCKTFSTPCKVPSNWTEVKSCEIFETKLDAEKALESLPENTSNEEVVKAREAFESGNYSEALEKAVEANNSLTEQEESSGPESEGLFSLLLTGLGSLVVIGLVLAGSYVSYQRYRRRKMIEELNQITEVIRREMRAGRIARDDRLLGLVETVRTDVDDGRFEKAGEDIEELRKALERSV